LFSASREVRKGIRSRIWWNWERAPMSLYSEISFWLEEKVCKREASEMKLKGFSGSRSVSSAAVKGAELTNN